MTPSRNVRVPTKRWRAGLAKAEREGTTLAAKINGWIEADLRDELQVQTADGPPPEGNGPFARRRA